jgi:hypothetical protein
VRLLTIPSSGALKSARHFLVDLKFIKRPRRGREGIVNQNELSFIAFRSSLLDGFELPGELFSQFSSLSRARGERVTETFIFLIVTVSAVF